MSGVRGQESGGRGQGAGVRGQGSGVRGQESGDRGQGYLIANVAHEHDTLGALVVRLCNFPELVIIRHKEAR